MSKEAVQPDVSNAIEQTKQVAAWLRLFAAPGQVVELRAPKAKRKYGRPVTVSGFYDDLEKLARDALHLSRCGLEDSTAFAPPGIYFTLNPINPALLARRANRYEISEAGQQAADMDISQRRLLLIDVDPVRPAEISSSDEEKVHAKGVIKVLCAFLESAGWPKPIIGDSGNGYHAYYRIDLPADDGGLVRSALYALAARFDTAQAKVDTTVFNPSRICKIPGTVSRKGDPIEARPHRTSRLVVIPESFDAVRPELIEALANEWRAKEAERKPAPIPQAMTPKPTSQRKGTKSHVDRARAYLSKVDGAVSGQHGSDQTIKAAGFLVRGFNLSIDEALPVLTEWNNKCDPPWDEFELRRKLEEASKHDGERGWLIKDEPEKPVKRRKSFPMPANLTEDSLLRPEQQQDAKLSQRFATMFRDKVLYVPEWKRWVEWEQRWSVDQSGVETQCAKRFSEFVWRESEKYEPTSDEDPENPLLTLAKKVSSSRFMHDVTNLARCEPDMSVSSNRLDSSPWLFNVKNGTIDLRTGILRSHARADFITKMCPLDYQPEALCPIWEEFLFHVMGQNSDLCFFLQSWFGYCITGDVSEHKVPIFWGTGGNGKSVLLNTILAVIGADYGNVAPADLLIQKNQNEHPTILADLFGRRMVVCSETSEGARFNEALLKSLSGGDPIKARRMHENYWEFNPSHKLILLTNYKPTVRGMDEGVWRRLLLVPFTQHYWDPAKDETGPEEFRQDKDLQSKLMAEAPGILRWLVDGAKHWYENRLIVPDVARAATSEYKEAQDVYQGFLTECCLIGPQFKVRGKPFFKAYEQWCIDNGEDVKSNTAFGRAMAGRPGFKKDTSNGVWYSGVGLRDVMESGEPPQQRDLF